MAWKPNFGEQDLGKIVISSLFECQNIPLELNHNQILYKIGLELGNMLGIENNLNQSNKVSFLMNTDFR